MSESAFLRHEPCPSCGSRNNLARYTDGHAYCFGCGWWQKGDTVEGEPRQKNDARFLTPAHSGLIDIEYGPLTKRRLNEDTCKLFRYGVGEFRGVKVQVATYCDEVGTPIAQKIRFPNKDFTLLGESRDLPLYGKNLWRNSGRMVVVTEGEIDALSVSQVQGNKWPVVSLPNGAQSAAKAVKRDLEWLEGYETVVFMFDMDEPGRKAAQQCAMLLTPGKAKIATLPMKDPNEMLVAGKVKELVDAVWNAKVYRPDGIVAGTELWDELLNAPTAASVPYPWEGLNTLTRGLRQRELVTLCSGSGIGKSSVCREAAHWLITQGHTVGYIALEESVRRTALGIVGITMNRPLHIEMAAGTCEIDEDELRAAYEATVGSGRMFLYDHFGSIDSDNLLSRIRYMVRSLGCQWIFLDHLSIVVSGMGDGDERRLIDNTMTALRSLVEELGCGMVLVSHLKRPEGRGHEEGAQTSLAQLRGSAAIGQLSDIVIGLERDQQDPDNKDLTTVRVLKNRFSGDTGLATRLTYDRSSGRLSEAAMVADLTPEVEF
jgi:twinkle protein